MVLNSQIGRLVDRTLDSGHIMSHLICIKHLNARLLPMKENGSRHLAAHLTIICTTEEPEM